MRVCGACFFGWFHSQQVDAVGECVNRPPVVFLVHDQDGVANFSSQRPLIGRQDRGCHFFSHKNEKPPTVAGRQDA